MQRIKGKRFVVEEVKKSERRRNPAPPFITSTLQQEAARKLKFRASETMADRAAIVRRRGMGQEGSVGLITYMRTDSTRISETAQREALDWIKKQFGESYLPDTPRSAPERRAPRTPTKRSGPTSVARTPETVKSYLSRDQYRLYKLIWERFVASQMASAVWTPSPRTSAPAMRCFGRRVRRSNFPAS